MKKIILIIIILLITGCSYQELNNLAIVTGIGVDYIDDNYEITAEILDLKKEGDSSNVKSVFYKGTGKTIPVAIRNIMKEYPKTIYLGHLELVLVGKDAINKIPELFNYFFSSPEASTESIIVTSKTNTAKEFFDIEEEFEDNSPTENLISMVENTTNHVGTVFETKFEEFYSQYLNEGLDPLIITISKDNKSKASESILNNMAPFKDGNILETLNEDEIISYNLINNNFNDIMLNSTYNNNPLTIFIYNPQSNLEIEVNDNINVTINIKTDGHVSQYEESGNLSDTKIRNEIETAIKNEIETKIKSLIDYCKNNNVDLLGIKNYIYKHQNQKFKDYQNLNIYEIANFKIKTKIDIFRYGLAYKGSDIS